MFGKLIWCAMTGTSNTSFSMCYSHYPYSLIILHFHKCNQTEMVCIHTYIHTQIYIYIYTYIYIYILCGWCDSWCIPDNIPVEIFKNVYWGLYATLSQNEIKIELISFYNTSSWFYCELLLLLIPAKKCMAIFNHNLRTFSSSEMTFTSGLTLSIPTFSTLWYRNHFSWLNQLLMDKINSHPAFLSF